MSSLEQSSSLDSVKILSHESMSSLEKCGRKLAYVEKFTCLGGMLSHSLRIDDGADNMVVKASVAYGWLRSSVLESKSESCNEAGCLQCHPPHHYPVCQ